MLMDRIVTPSGFCAHEDGGEIIIPWGEVSAVEVAPAPSVGGCMSPTGVALIGTCLSAIAIATASVVGAVVFAPLAAIAFWIAYRLARPINGWRVGVRSSSATAWTAGMPRAQAEAIRDEALRRTTRRRPSRP